MSAKQDASTRVATAIAALRTYIANLVTNNELDKVQAQANKAEKELEAVVEAIEDFAKEVASPPPPVQKN